MKINSVSFLLVLIISITAFGQETTEKLTATEAEGGKTVALSPSATARFIPNPPVNGITAKPNAARSSSANSDEWHLEITPYLWLAGIEGNLRVGNELVRVDSSGSDVIKQLDFAFATRLEAQKGRFGIHVDENYVNLGTSGIREGIIFDTPYDVQPTMNIFEAGASYTAYAVPSSDASMPDVFSFEVLGGLRHFHMGLELTAGTNTAEGSRNLVDGYGGIRLKGRPHPKWTLSTKGTIGGGGSNFAWTANGLVDYQFCRSMSISGGYQVLDMDADDASNAVGFDGRLKGLFMGFTFHR